MADMDGLYQVHYVLLAYYAQTSDKATISMTYI